MAISLDERAVAASRDDRRQAEEWAIAGVLFDMGDILYDATVWRRWLLNLLRHMGVVTRYRTFYRVWDDEFLDAVHRGVRPYAAAFHDFLSSAGLSAGQIDEIEAASASKRRQLESQLRPLQGVTATLPKLAAAGLPLGVLSDSENTAAEIRERLTRMGIGDYFPVVITSVELGCTKPAAACYRAAARAMDLPTGDIAFVGHDADELAGARAVGMKAIAFNYEHGVVADAYVDDFEDLVAACAASQRALPPSEAQPCRGSL